MNFFTLCIYFSFFLPLSVSLLDKKCVPFISSDLLVRSEKEGAFKPIKSFWKKLRHAHASHNGIELVLAVCVYVCSKFINGY